MRLVDDDNELVRLIKPLGVLLDETGVNEVQRHVSCRPSLRLGAQL